MCLRYLYLTFSNLQKPLFRAFWRLQLWSLW